MQLSALPCSLLLLTVSWKRWSHFVYLFCLLTVQGPMSSPCCYPTWWAIWVEVGTKSRVLAISAAGRSKCPPGLSVSGNNRNKGSLRRIRSLGALGEGSGWDLRVCLAPPRPGPAACVNLGIWEPGNQEILEFGDLGTWKSRNVGSRKSKKSNSQNQNSCRPKCRQGLDW